jgi:hypothetical protein
VRRLQLEFEDFGLILLLSKLEACVSVMTAEPDIKVFVSFKFLSEVFLLRNGVLMRLEVLVNVLF